MIRRALALPMFSVVAAMVIVAGCTGEEQSDVMFDVEATVSEYVPTVVTVGWQLDGDEPDAAWIEFGPDDGYGMEAPVDVSTGAPYEALLLGNPASADVHFRVVAEVGGEQLTSDDHTVTTGSLPSSLPELTIDVAQDGLFEEGFVVTSVFTSPAGAAIIDRQGRFVWWHSDFDEDTQISRARLSEDGMSMLYWLINLNGPQGSGDDDQELVQVSLDGADVQRWSLPDGHHDFTTLPDGTVTYLEYDARSVSGVSGDVTGDRIVELAPDGTTTTVYSVWDDFDYDPDSQTMPGQEWSHLNAVDYVESEDAYLVSSLGFGSLLLIDRASGELRWVLGGDQNDFDGGGNLFAHQHQFEMLDGAVLVFDNGDPSRNYSQALLLQLDQQEMSVEQTWSYQPDPSVFCFSLGDVHRFDSGHTLVTFSTSGQIDEVDAAGELVWRLNLDLGGAVGYVLAVDSLYPSP